MKTSLEKFYNFIINNRYIVLLLAILLSWYPILFVPFINDDYQILGFHFNKGLLALIEPFWKPDVSQFYWRPVGNLLHPLLLMVGGFHPALFRIISILIYTACCFTLLFFLDRIKFSKPVSLLTTVIFAVLPSHELQIAWIADQGESLFTIFLALTFVYYYKAFYSVKRKYYIIAFVFFLLSILIKETAYAGIFIPLLVYLLQDKYDRDNIIKAAKHIGFAFLSVLVILLYRLIFIGGSPFNPVHFANPGLVKWIINFLIYIPLAFFSPEALEKIQYLVHNWFYLALFFMIFLAVLFIIIKSFISLSKDKKKIFVFGLSWFVIFIIPAIPNLMRWYVFSASFGLMVVIAVILESVISSRKQVVIYSAVIICLFFLIINNCNLMYRWQDAGKRLQTALVSFKEAKNEIKKDTMIVWAVPDKLNRVPMMKLGVKETVQWALQDKKIEVLAPLRVELVDSRAVINLVALSDSSLTLEVKGGRFMRERSESKSIAADETDRFEYEGNIYLIDTHRGGTYTSKSKVQVNLKNSSIKDVEQFYFNGENFVRIDKRTKHFPY